jgi:hypothetical protein
VALLEVGIDVPERTKPPRETLRVLFAGSTDHAVHVK